MAKDISVCLEAGELVCLLGPNGAGKSTLLRSLAGMQPPISGEVRLLGDDIYKLAPQDLAKSLSLVLTDKVDVGMLSAYTLVSLGRHPYTDWWGRLTPEDEAIIHWAIKSVGALHLAARQVSELSDGESQKIMIARALAQSPMVMLLDEPTAFLDLPRRVEIMQLSPHIAPLCSPCSYSFLAKVLNIKAKYVRLSRKRYRSQLSASSTGGNLKDVGTMARL